MSKNTTRQPLRASDLRAATQLVTQATLGIAHLAEGVHQSVWGTLGVGDRAAGHTSGITALVYAAMRGVTRLAGRGVDAALTKLEPWLASADAAPPESAQREAVLAALNGVLGDHLAASGNPLATPMSLRFEGQALHRQAMPAKAQVTGKVLVLAHGLCMNDLQWAGHGPALAAALGCTPVYARYNSGLHTSDNGTALCGQLAQLAAHWPVPLQELSLLGHSMGGLVIRSAVHTAQQQQAVWLTALKNIVFLGTPHHGAPLERGGHGVDLLLGVSKFSAPLARLGQLRSAGITDLRFGNVQDADWAGRDRFATGAHSGDARQPLPLPAAVACYTVAAHTGERTSDLRSRVLGDGLVPIASALGQHADPRFRLAFTPQRQYVAEGVNHLQLLGDARVYAQLRDWFAAPAH